MKMILKIFPVIVLILSVNLGAQTVLDKYIKEGLQNNIVLQQKKISYDKAAYSLKIATSYFFPSINFNASYTSGEGGRSIALPIGDLMNPVYQTLNQLTGSNAFPQISNVNENLFPNKFYDVKFRTSLPLINSDLIFNRSIKSEQSQIAEYEIEMYKRELVKEIKVAYFNYLSAETAATIYDNALSLANEGKRVNESLLKNGSGLPVYVLRSESEIENIKAQKIEAQNQSLNAKSYFNFLLNRKLDTVIDSDLSFENEIAKAASNLNAEFSLAKREELMMLQKGISINQSVVDMNKYYWIPKVSAFLDLGAQDQKWKYNSKSQYYLFGIQLDVPIFESFRNYYKIEESELELKNAELNQQLVSHQLQLSANIATNGLTVANQNYQSSLKQFEVAQSYHSLVMKGYQEGVNTFLETIDARTQLLNSELLVNINKYKIMIASANCEREKIFNKIEY